MNEITAYVQAQVAAAVRRAATPAAFAIVAGLFVLFAVAALFAALFFWLEPDHGAIAAALICAAAALVIAFLAALPLMFRRKPPPPAPQQQTAALPQFVSLMARTAPGMGPRQIIVAAALVGAAIVLSARGAKK